MWCTLASLKVEPIVPNMFTFYHHHHTPSNKNGHLLRLPIPTTSNAMDPSLFTKTQLVLLHTACLIICTRTFLRDSWNSAKQINASIICTCQTFSRHSVNETIRTFCWPDRIAECHPWSPADAPMHSRIYCILMYLLIHDCSCSLTNGTTPPYFTRILSSCGKIQQETWLIRSQMCPLSATSFQGKPLIL